MSPKGIDVLIVAAGPTGLTLALDLRRRGGSVRIVDRSTGPQPGSRGFSLKPRTLEVFDDLGVAAGIVAASRVPTRTRVHLNGALLTDFEIRRSAPSPSRRYPDSVALPQWRTEGLLREALRAGGLDVEFGSRLTGFDADQGGVTAELSSGGGTEWVRAAYLVGCDGGRSTGDSAPDGIGLIGPGARRVRLTDLYRGTHFTLLGFGERHADLAARWPNPALRAYQVVPDGNPTGHRLVDADGNIRRAYRARNGTLALVRPDGYLGLLSLDDKVLYEYLESLGLTGRAWPELSRGPRR